MEVQAPIPRLALSPLLAVAMALLTTTLVATAAPVVVELAPPQ
jgi:hypothetical protein